MMEFSEKMQKLRKQNNLTQEELAAKLFISRTAISKWESGKGYPSIEVLKQISSLFGVSVDDLLSSKQILELAEQDKIHKLKKNNGLIFGMLDLLMIIMLILPLYAFKVNNTIYQTTLLGQNDLLNYVKISYLMGYISIFIIGIIEVILSILEKEQTLKRLTVISITIHIFLVLFLIITKEPYACSMVFILLIFKLFLYFSARKS